MTIFESLYIPKSLTIYRRWYQQVKKLYDYLQWCDNLYWFVTIAIGMGRLTPLGIRRLLTKPPVLIAYLWRILLCVN